MAHITMESAIFFGLIFWSLMQEFTTPSGVPFHVFIAKAADGTASILEEAGTGLGIIPLKSHESSG